MPKLLEYEDEYKAFSKDQTKANINHDKQHQKAFVQQFVETSVTGIRLKREGNQLDIMYKKRLHYAYARAYICVHLDEML